MCGIAGQIRFGRPPIGDDFVRAACTAMQHRGPDETTLKRGEDAVLGISRLRIIGLTGGGQPAQDSAGKVVCVVNGEIYNHHMLRRLLAARGRTVRGTSDAHVVPELYAEFGDAFVDHLSGMFAIALYDLVRARLLLITDRFGKKPLFYGQPTDGGFAFASELPALTQCPGLDLEMDAAAIDQYLSYRIIPAPHTIYRGIAKLPPATLLVADVSGCSQRVYWSRPFDGSLRETPIELIVDRVDTLLRSAVSDRLESEVPLGAMLSGGLDSSLVVALAERSVGPGLHTFSIGFDSPQFDERREAAAVAAFCGTTHHYQTVRPDVAGDIADNVLRHIGEPYGFPSAIASWAMYQLASQHVTVVLTGDGSDEIFCGYSRYQRLLRTPAHANLADRYQSILADGVPGDVKAELYHPRFKAVLSEYPRNYLTDRFARTEPSASDLERAMHVDATFWLSDAQLVKIDRMAMAHSVEPRSPMLDHRLVEYVRGIPSGLNLVAGVEKHVLKQVAARYLPSPTVERRKQELAVPLEEWITTALRPLVSSTLLCDESLERGYFVPDRLRKFVAAYRPQNAYALWTLYMLERWHRLRSEDAGSTASALPAKQIS